MATNPSRIRTCRGRTAALAVAGVLLAVVTTVGWAGSSLATGHASAVGQPPPEWAANAASWPAHNHDLSNTRATTQTPINSQTVSKLKVKWRFRRRSTPSRGSA